MGEPPIEPRSPFEVALIESLELQRRALRRQANSFDRREMTDDADRARRRLREIDRKLDALGAARRSVAEREVDRALSRLHNRGRPQ